MLKLEEKLTSFSVGLGSMIFLNEVVGSVSVVVEVEVDVVSTRQSCCALLRAWSNSSAKLVTSESFSDMASTAISLFATESQMSSRSSVTKELSNLEQQEEYKLWDSMFM